MPPPPLIPIPYRFTHAVSDPAALSSFIGAADRAARNGDPIRARTLLNRLASYDGGISRSAEYWEYRVRLEIALGDVYGAVKTLENACRAGAEPRERLQALADEVDNVQSVWAQSQRAQEQSEGGESGEGTGSAEDGEGAGRVDDEYYGGSLRDDSALGSGSLSVQSEDLSVLEHMGAVVGDAGGLESPERGWDSMDGSSGRHEASGASQESLPPLVDLECGPRGEHGSRGLLDREANTQDLKASPPRIPIGAYLRPGSLGPEGSVVRSHGDFEASGAPGAPETSGASESSPPKFAWMQRQARRAVKLPPVPRPIPVDPHVAGGSGTAGPTSEGREREAEGQAGEAKETRETRAGPKIAAAPGAGAGTLPAAATAALAPGPRRHSPAPSPSSKHALEHLESRPEVRAERSPQEASRDIPNHLQNPRKGSIFSSSPVFSRGAFRAVARDPRDLERYNRAAMVQGESYFSPLREQRVPDPLPGIAGQEDALPPLSRSREGETTGPGGPSRGDSPLDPQGLTANQY